MADREPVDRRQLRPARGRVEARRQALAPRGGAQPREVDNIRRLQLLLRERETLVRVGHIVGVEQYHVGYAAQRRNGVGVTVRAPQHGRQFGHHDRIDDRLEPTKVLGPHVDLDVLAHHPEAAAGRVLVAHHRHRVERVPSLLDRAQDRAGGVVAADPLEPVGDLALPRAVDHHHQVQHAGGSKRLVRGVPLPQHLAQRRLDRVRVRVALRPDVFAHSRCHFRSPSSSASASGGPADPAGY